MNYLQASPEDAYFGLRLSERIGFDTETTGLDPRKSKVRLLQMSDGTDTYVVDLFQYPDISALKPIFEDTGIRIIMQNAVFDMSFMYWQYGITVQSAVDTMLAAQLLGYKEANLKALARIICKLEIEKESQRSDWSVPRLTERQLTYAAKDAEILIPIWKTLVEELNENGLGKVAMLEFRTLRAVVELETNGLGFDVERCREMAVEAAEEKKKLAQQFSDMLPKEKYDQLTLDESVTVNMNSPKQLVESLHKVGLKVESTSEGVLSRQNHPVAKKLLEYRKVEKKLASFLIPYPDKVSEVTGRIHPRFHQVKVKTGRFCVAAGTNVEILRDVSKYPKGVPIEDVKAGDVAYTFDDGLKLRLREVIWSGKTGHMETLIIRWTGTGNKHEGSLEVTPEHEVRLVSGRYVKAKDLKPGDRVLSLSRDVTRFGYARLYPTGYGTHINEGRFIDHETTGLISQHVHHVDGNKLNNVQSNLVGMTASEHTSHHMKSITDERREGLSKSSAKMWKDHRERLMKSIRRGEDSHNWLGLEKGWMEAVLWENCGKPTAFRDLYGIDYKTAMKYLKMHGIDWKRIASCFTKRGEEIDHDFYTRVLENIPVLGFDGALKKAGIGSRRWKEVRERFEVPIGNHRIIEVVSSGRLVDVYDIEVEETHNFIAGEICIHNSASGPNTQQLSREGGLRELFIAAEDTVLISADYEQQELRVLAEISNDASLRKAFEDGIDLHKNTYSVMTGTPIEEVTKEQRNVGKTLAFGILYGMSAAGLGKRLGIKKDEAAELMTQFFSGYQGVRSWSRDVTRKGAMDKFVRSLMGRKVFLDSPDGRQSVNYVIQSSSADMTKLAMCLAVEDGLRIINVVHDEIVIEHPEDDAEDGQKRLEAAMLQASDQLLKKVKGGVDSRTSKEWGK